MNLDESDQEGNEEVNFFLRPVFEYNISEKIIEANEQLFAEINEGEDSSSVKEPSTKGTKRVTFCETLEDCVSHIESENEQDEIIEDISDLFDGLHSYKEDDNVNQSDFIVEEHQLELDSNNLKINNQLQVNEIKPYPVDSAETIEEICEELEGVTLEEEVEHIDKIIDQKDTTVQAKDTEKQTMPTKEFRRRSSSSSQVSVNRIASAKKLQTKSRQCDNTPMSLTLGYKACCEYKYLESQKLPAYCGHVSQYGLTKEQLDARAASYREKQIKRAQRLIKKQEEEELKSEANETAFARWLVNKLRFPPNRTINMYDKNSTKTRKKPQSN